MLALKKLPGWSLPLATALLATLLWLLKPAQAGQPSSTSLSAAVAQLGWQLGAETQALQGGLYRVWRAHRAGCPWPAFVLPNPHSAESAGLLSQLPRHYVQQFYLHGERYASNPRLQRWLHPWRVRLGLAENGQDFVLAVAQRCAD